MNVTVSDPSDENGLFFPPLGHLQPFRVQRFPASARIPSAVAIPAM